MILAVILMAHCNNCDAYTIVIQTAAWWENIGRHLTADKMQSYVKQEPTMAKSK